MRASHHPHTTYSQKSTRGAATAARPLTHALSTPPPAHTAQKQWKPPEPGSFLSIAQRERGKEGRESPRREGRRRGGVESAPPREEPGEREPRLLCVRGRSVKNGRQFRGRRLSPAPGKKAGMLGFLRPGVRAWPCWAAPARAQPRALIPLPPAASLAPAVCAAEIRRRRGPARLDKRLGHYGPNDSF